ncbi:MAG: hypothetical protein J6C49_03995, partial [Elusimicrobiaceae bacterium]|nr:hypothetical protein [Elusimicrobiaceae bacterium]
VPWGLRNYHYAAPQLVRAIRSGFEKSYNLLQCYSALHGIIKSHTEKFLLSIYRFFGFAVTNAASFPMEGGGRGKRKNILFFPIITLWTNFYWKIIKII